MSIDTCILSILNQHTISATNLKSQWHLLHCRNICDTRFWVLVFLCVCVETSRHWCEGRVILPVCLMNRVIPSGFLSKSATEGDRPRHCALSLAQAGHAVMKCSESSSLRLHRVHMFESALPNLWAVDCSQGALFSLSWWSWTSSSLDLELLWANLTPSVALRGKWESLTLFL